MKYVHYNEVNLILISTAKVSVLENFLRILLANFAVYITNESKKITSLEKKYGVNKNGSNNKNLDLVYISGKHMRCHHLLEMIDVRALIAVGVWEEELEKYDFGSDEYNRLEKKFAKEFLLSLDFNIEELRSTLYS